MNNHNNNVEKKREKARALRSVRYKIYYTIQNKKAKKREKV